MKTLQLHLVAPPAAEPAQVDATELELQVWWLEPAQTPFGGVEYQSYSGALRIPAALLQQLQQATPVIESLLPDGVRVVWSGQQLPALPPDKLLPKLAKVLRGLKRLWSDG